MRRHLAALALLSALASPVPASASAIITEGDTFAVSGNNDFQAQILAMGYNRFTSTGASITLDENSIIEFFFLGAESGYNDTFNASGVVYNEANGNFFPGGIPIGSAFFAAGALTVATINFTTDGLLDGGANAGPGDAGFGIFLQEGFQSGGAVSSFLLGYDDQITNPDDDNHDDLMVLAVVRSAVPEPGTWAMLLAGFGMLGAAMRRKSRAPRFRAAIA